jgi:predicted RNA-binding protein with PIN domain
MDKYTEYLLDQIESFRKDIKEEPGCEYAVGALVQALVKYQAFISVQA